MQVNKNNLSKPERTYNKDRIRRIKEAAEQAKSADPDWYKDAPASVLPEADDDVKPGGMKTPPFLKEDVPIYEEVVNKKLTLNELTQCNKDSTQVQSIISGKGSSNNPQQNKQSQPNNLELQRQKKIQERENYNKMLAESLDKASEKWHVKLKELQKNRNIQDSTGLKDSLFDENDNEEKEKSEKESTEKNSRKFGADYAGRLDMLLQRGFRNNLMSKSVNNIRSLHDRSFNRWTSKLDSMNSISDLKYNLLNTRIGLGIHSNHFSPPMVNNNKNNSTVKPTASNLRHTSRINGIETNLYSQALNILPLLNNQMSNPYNQQMFLNHDTNGFINPFFHQSQPIFSNTNNMNYTPNNNLVNPMMGYIQSNNYQPSNQMSQNITQPIHGSNYNNAIQQQATPYMMQHDNQIPNNALTYQAWNLPSQNQYQNFSQNPQINCYQNQPFNLPINPSLNNQFYQERLASTQSQQQFFVNDLTNKNQTAQLHTENINTNNQASTLEPPYDTVYQRINDLADKLEKLNATVDNLSWNRVPNTKSIIKSSNSDNREQIQDSSGYQKKMRFKQQENSTRICNCPDCLQNSSNSSNSTPNMTKPLQNSDKRVRFQIEEDKLVNNDSSEIEQNNMNLNITKSRHPLSIQHKYHDNTVLSNNFNKYDLPPEAMSIIVSNYKRNNMIEFNNNTTNSTSNIITNLKTTNNTY